MPLLKKLKCLMLQEPLGVLSEVESIDLRPSSQNSDPKQPISALVNISAVRPREPRGRREVLPHKSPIICRTKAPFRHVHGHRLPCGSLLVPDVRVPGPPKVPKIIDPILAIPLF